MKIHHRNLVSLLGYCDEPEIKALIYEYVAKGNLHENLSGKNENFLTWDQRLCIAVDAAKGMREPNEMFYIQIMYVIPIMLN